MFLAYVQVLYNSCTSCIMGVFVGGKLRRGIFMYSLVAAAAAAAAAAARAFGIGIVKHYKYDLYIRLLATFIWGLRIYRLPCPLRNN